MNSNSNKLTLENFKVGVDNVIFSIDSSKNRLLVLLVKRSDKPYINQWGLPGTLVRKGESLDTIRQRVQTSLKSLPEDTHKITKPSPIQVNISQPLETLRQSLIV